MSEWTSILDDLTTYLRWLHECGERTEEFSPETLKDFLSGPAAKNVSRSAAADAVPSPAAPGLDPAAFAQFRQSAAVLAVAEKPGTLPDIESPEARRTALAAIALKVAPCRLCGLCEKRIQTVPGQGNAISPDIMFVGEAPGAEDDEQGQAFVGKAGQLLTKMIEAMGYARDEVFVANVCKCRPPNDRQPSLEEMQACIPYLRAQIAIIRPKTIVALGATAVKGLMETTQGISKLRGTWTTFAGLPLMPTFHPTYLLRFPSAKQDAWEDLKKVLTRLGKPVPVKKRAG